MKTLLDDLATMVRRCNRAASTFEKEPLVGQINAIEKAIDSVAASHSGSWIGYQADVYYDGFRRPPGTDMFSIEWGLKELAFGEGTSRNWQRVSFEDVLAAIKARSKLADLDVATAAGKEIDRLVGPIKEELLSTLDAVLTEYKGDTTLAEVRKEVAEHKDHFSGSEIATAMRPGIFRGSFFSRDSEAMAQGLRIPPHIQIEASLKEEISYADGAKRLGVLANRATMYLEKRMEMKGKAVGKTDGKVFIGHGGSKLGLELRIFLETKLKLSVDEYNIQSAAGLSRKERLQAMLDDACFAFLVMTAEDQQADGKLRARENVVHEVGLFQGRLGFERAIVLLEDGCNEFSNIEGIGQIRFDKGKILSKSEEIRAVLEREGVE